MKSLDFTNRELIDKYYRAKFTFDIGNYFVVNNWAPMKYYEKNAVTNENVVEHLYQRSGFATDGDPAVYMGARPWWNVSQNFEFSGMFAYLFIADRCIRKVCGNEEAFRFCKEFNWPLFNDVQPAEAFNIIAVLKEASLTPYRAEAANYIIMLDNVIPYMKEITHDFLSQLPSAIEDEIDTHIQCLYDWVRNTQDELLYLFGILKVRKEYMPEGSDYPARYYLLVSLKWMFDRLGVCSWDEIEKLNWLKRSYISSSGWINSFDGPVTPHYSDLEFMREYDSDIPEDPFVCKELSEQEKKENSLYNLLLNLYWDDDRFEKDGRFGLKDCWGRVIVPAEFEDANGLHSSLFLTRREPCVSLKLNGQWALAVRGDYRRLRTDYKFDAIDQNFNGAYSIRIGNGYGLYTLSGRELIPIEMDDIYSETPEGDFLYRKGKQYGVRLNNGTHTVLLDEIDLDSGYYLSVRVGSQWGYIGQNGQFVSNRKDAFLKSYFCLDSMLHCHNGFPADVDFDADPKTAIPLEDFMKKLELTFRRFSTKADVKGSCLDDHATVSMGINRKVIYYELLPSGLTFCIDMERPYQMKLLDDRYHDMPQSWEGYEEEKALLQQWLNEFNKKTGVRNWAELAYLFCVCPRNEGRPLKISYAPRKAISISKSDFEEGLDFPQIQFNNI